MPANVCASSALISDVVTEHALHRWHLRFGHLGVSQIVRLSTSGSVKGIKLPSKPLVNLPMCDSCAMGKMHRLNIPTVSTRPDPTSLLAIISADIAVVNYIGIGKVRYFAVFVCVASRRNWVYLLRHRSDILNCFKTLHKFCLVQYNLSIKCLRADGEFPTSGFREFADSVGCRFEFTCADSSFQNGHAERMIRTISEMALSQLYYSGLPLVWWGEFVLTSSYILNRSPASALGDITPFEVWKNYAPDVSHFRTIGCLAWVRVPSVLRDKVQPKAKPLVFIGYSEERKGWKFANPVTRRVTFSRDAIFDETRTFKPIMSKCPTKSLVDGLIDKPLASDPSGRPNSLSSLALARNDCNYAATYVSELLVDDSAFAVTSAFDDGVRLLEPKTFKAAMISAQRDDWTAAMQSELKSLVENNTWTLQPLPAGKKTIRTKWVYKIKQFADGSIDRYKARLVALGFTQRKNIDYFETFAPVARYETLRLLFAYAAHFNSPVFGLDVSTAFLNGKVDAEIFITMPAGFIYPEGKAGFVGKLHKSLYGLKQSPRAWHKVLLELLFSLGFTQSNGDPCLLFRRVKGALVLFLIYVDDLNFVCPDPAFTTKLKKSIMTRFKCRDLGRIDWLLGMCIEYPAAGGIFIHQQKYVLDLLERFSMTYCNPVSTPADSNVNFSPEMCSTDESFHRSIPYRAAVGGLLHLARCTRPDIAYIVNALSRYLTKYGPAHWTAVKRVLAYLKGTSGYGIFYERGSPNSDFSITAWCDAAFADDLESRRSTCGYFTFLAGGPLTWKSGLQPDFRPSLSTTEAEYVAAFLATKEIVWLRQLFHSIGCVLSSPTPLHEDNTSTISMSQDAGVFHSRTKHIDIKYHYVRSCMGVDITMIPTPTEDQLADILTKALSKTLFIPFRDIILRRMTS